MVLLVVQEELRDEVEGEGGRGEEEEQEERGLAHSGDRDEYYSRILDGWHVLRILGDRDGDCSTDFRWMASNKGKDERTPES